MSNAQNNSSGAPPTSPPPWPNQPPPPPPGPPPVAAPPPARDPVRESRQWAMFCHLAALVGYFVPIPCANIIGPLIIWQVKKDQYPFVDQQGREALNFQISVTIYELVCVPLIFVFCIGVPLMVAIGIAALVLVIIAAVKANSGAAYRYPLTIRFV